MPQFCCMKSSLRPYCCIFPQVSIMFHSWSLQRNAYQLHVHKTMLQSCSLFAGTSHALNSPTPAVSYMQPGEIHFPKSPPSALHTPLIHRHNLQSALLCQTQHYCELQRFAGKRGHLKLYRLNAKLIVYKELYYNSCARQKPYLCNRARNRLALPRSS